jgi:uncharacterized membrane protein YkvA (DUF1232 family)
MMEDVRAVIESAKARDKGQLEALIRKRFPEGTEEQIREGVESVTAIVDSVPALLALADSEAERRGLARMVRPVLGRAVRYFVAPIDMVPEMTHGLAGLVDDAYLAIRLIEHVNSGPQPLIGWEFDEPLDLLRALLTPNVINLLDRESFATLDAVSGEVSDVWSGLAREA